MAYISFYGFWIIFSVWIFGRKGCWKPNWDLTNPEDLTNAHCRLPQLACFTNSGRQQVKKKNKNPENKKNNKNKRKKEQRTKTKAGHYYFWGRIWDILKDLLWYLLKLDFFPPASLIISWIFFAVCGLFVRVLLCFCFLTCNLRSLISFKSYILRIMFIFIWLPNTLLKKKKIQWSSQIPQILPDCLPPATPGPEQTFQCSTQSR